MDSINKLINIFKQFPTVGSRTASRFVYYLIKLPEERVNEFINAVSELKNKVKLCQLCYKPFEFKEEQSSAQICEICADPKRDKNLLCIVEKETDLLSIESTKKYNGLYFILGGTIATMGKSNLNQIRIEELKKRIKNLSAQSKDNLNEIIIALNPTPEGKTTSILVENAIKEIILSPAVKITYLAKGIPVGGELEYADEETLESALEGRR